MHQSPLLLNGPPACLSSLLLKNTDLHYVTEYDEYSLWHGDDLGLTLSAGRFRSGIKETLAVTGTVMNWKGLKVGQGMWLSSTQPDIRDAAWR